ncbi:helix-turn-helix domain-containing protein, partial [Streptomyces clavuligerus]
MLHQEERRAAQEERRLTRERERRHRRQRAVLEVLGGRPVVEVARSHGVSRQTVHTWRKRYLEQGEAGLEDRSRRPHRSPRRLDDSTVALICSLRREHPGWGAQRLRATLARLGVEPVPSRSTVHRALVRNGLVGAEAAGPAGSRAGSPPPSPPPCPS